MLYQLRKDEVMVGGGAAHVSGVGVFVVLSDNVIRVSGGRPIQGLGDNNHMLILICIVMSITTCHKIKEVWQGGYHLNGFHT